MYAILASAVGLLLSFLARSVLVKFVTFFALFFVVVAFVAVLAPLLPTSSGLSGALGNLSASVWYFLDLFQVPYGISATISAFVLRFIIRRIPVIG